MHFIINMAFMLIYISKLVPWVLEWHENFCMLNQSISVHIENVICLVCSMRISPHHEIHFIAQNYFVHTINMIFYRRSWMLHIIENKLYVLVKMMKEIMKVLMKALMKQCRNDDTTHHHIWRSLLQYQTIMKKCWPRIDRKIGLKAYSKYFVYTNAEGIHKSFFYHPCLLLSPLNSRHFCLHDFKEHVGKRIMSIYLISYSL